MTLLRGRELQEHVAATVVGVLGEPAEQRAAVRPRRRTSLEPRRCASRIPSHVAYCATSAHAYPLATRREDRHCGEAALQTLREDGSVSSRLPRGRGPGVARRYRPRRGRARAGCRRTSPGVSLPDADVDERADDRAHHLPAERGGADLVAQHAVAEVDPARLEHPPHAWSSPRGPCGRTTAKSCSPTNGSAPRRSSEQVERLGHPPRVPGEERVGRRRGSRSCSGTSRQCAECRASKPASTSSASRTTISGPSCAVHRARCTTSASTPSAARATLTTWPHACTPASVRPAHVSVDRRARSTLLERLARARPRRCAARAARRSRGSRCRRTRRRAGRTAARRRSRRGGDSSGSWVTPVRCAPWARCRRGAGRASGSAGSRRCGRRSAARSRRTACA